MFPWHVKFNTFHLRAGMCYNACTVCTFTPVPNSDDFVTHGSRDPHLRQADCIDKHALSDHLHEWGAQASESLAWPRNKECEDLMSTVLTRNAESAYT
jgi:hypothetical protein